jgi:hypothetical protein
MEEEEDRERGGGEGGGYTININHSALTFKH